MKRGDRSTINFLVPHLGAPVVGPVIRMARMLEDAARVRIVGADFGEGACPMYGGAFPFTPVPAKRLYRLPDFYWESRRIERAATGDILIAVKAFAHTLGVALSARKRRGCRVVAYLDEWDNAPFAGRSAFARLLGRIRHVHHPMEWPHIARMERRIREADLVISTTTFLQRRFGGVVIPQGADTDFFKPQPPEQTARLKKELGLENARVIVFGGVARPHKGVETILEAMCRLCHGGIRPPGHPITSIEEPRTKNQEPRTKNQEPRTKNQEPSIILLVIGPRTGYLEELERNPAYAPFLVWGGVQPHARMPEYLDVADLFVLPLQDTPLAQSQMPCKVFEYMAMGKPIVATAVSDLPSVLDGCGRVVKPVSIDALADEVARLLKDPVLVARLGRAAREKCQALYSLDKTREKLLACLPGVEKKMG